MPRGQKNKGSPARAQGRPKRRKTGTGPKNDGKERSKGTRSMDGSGTEEAVHSGISSGSENGDHLEFPSFSGNVQNQHNVAVDIENFTPPRDTSCLDNVGANVPSKIKERIWAGKFVDFSTLLKPEREALNDLEAGDIKIKNQKIVLEPSKPRSFLDIDDWTSAYIIFMSVMLEKFQTRTQEMLKYMRDIRLASRRSTRFGWGTYDEQYRLRKERDPYSSWGVINQELWLFYVHSNTRYDTHNYQGISTYKTNNWQNNNVSNSSASASSTHINTMSNRQVKRDTTPNQSSKQKTGGILYCRFYNQGTDCHFYPRCRYLHACEICGGKHRRVQCRSSQQGR